MLEFLDADYTFVNERLARHYGIPGVDGRRVSPGLAGRHAAGRRPDPGERPGGDVQPDADLAGQARQVDPGEHPGCTALAAAVGRGSTQGRQRARARRARSAQRMERHRTDPACASCHRRMDPLGFGLENFDAIGGWRTHEGERADRSVRPAARRAERSRARPSCGPRSCRAAMRSPAASPRRCSPTPSAAASNEPTAVPSTGSSPGSPATDTGSRPWCSPSSRASRSGTPEADGGRP